MCMPACMTECLFQLYKDYDIVYISPNTLPHPPAPQGSQMEEEIRQLERKLKRALSEQEHLREHNTYLTSELDRFVHVYV